MKNVFPPLTCSPIFVLRASWIYDCSCPIASDKKAEAKSKPQYLYQLLSLNCMGAAQIRTCEITLLVRNTVQIFVLVMLPLEDLDK